MSIQILGFPASCIMSQTSAHTSSGILSDEMAGWHHWLNKHESEWTPGVGDGQGGLACCDSWGHRVGHNWATELNWGYRPPGTSVHENSLSKNTETICPPPVDLSDPGIEPKSGSCFITNTTWEALWYAEGRVNFNLETAPKVIAY